MTATTWRRLTTAALVIYWLAMVVGTHVPKGPSLPLEQGDKLLHSAAYAGLTLLAAACWSAWRGPIGRRELALIVAVIAIYGAVDELTQIPVGRDCDWRDWLADMFGVACAIAVLIVLRLLRNRRAVSAPPA